MNDEAKDLQQVEKVEINNDTATEIKTFTQEEVDKLIQAETDRKTTKALQTAKEKWEAEYNEKLEVEKDEATKLASMTAEDRAKAELEKEKTEWEKQRAEFLKEKMELETVKLLSSESLPASFANFVIAEDAKTVKENIDSFKSEWNKALNEAVSERLKSKTPSSSQVPTDVLDMSKEEFGKLPYKERLSMLQVDPDLMSKLKQQ